MATECSDSTPVKDSAPPLSPAPTKDSGMSAITKSNIHVLVPIFEFFNCTVLSEGLSFSLYLSSSLAPSAAAAFPSPPTLSLPLPLSRVGLGDNRAPVPQAVVKPQVLTHLIEGFVIQEGAEPFPVSVLCYDNTHYTLNHICTFYFFMLNCSSLSGLYLI